MKKLLFISLAVAAGINAQAQDKIYRNNGKVVEAKIVEIGASEVKYKNFNNQDGPVYVLETDRIQRIQFENGTVQKFEDNLLDMERYAGQHTKAVKLKFSSFLYGYTELGYEQLIKPAQSLELNLGIIGAGKPTEKYVGLDMNGNPIAKTNTFGAYIGTGYKFGKMPSFFIFGKTKQGHIMQGSYVKPVVYLGYYGTNVLDNVGAVRRNNVFLGAANLEMGKQWIFGNSFVLDIFGGFGIGFDTWKKDYMDTGWFMDDSHNFNYAFHRMGNSPSFTLSGGLRIGLLVDWFEKKENKKK